jgi:predicted acylesterase/phospholipase RssA
MTAPSISSRFDDKCLKSSLIRRSTLWSLLLLAGLAGCTQNRPAFRDAIAIPAGQIRATDYGLEASAGPDEAVVARLRKLTASTNICARPELAAGAPRPAPSPDYLVLSGGSLHGAFGAGFFLGLQEQGALPPEPVVVTGVSTGSLQSTMLFLARQPVPRDRDYRWVGGMATEDGPGLPPLKAGRSNIEDLALAYSIRKEGDILQKSSLGPAALVFHGATATLDPLRRRLLALITPETIREVAVEACRGRHLFVGVTDVDDGQGYALDLTALALQAYDGTASANRMARVRRAYVEALVASSSVPAGALPVTLELRDIDVERHRTHMFVDGGARFGVFLRALRRDYALTAGAAPDSNIVLIVNTDLSTGPWHPGNSDKPTDKWSLPTLGLRTVDILENQVYQLSVSNVQTQAESLRMAYLSNQYIGGGTPDDHSYRGKTCQQRHEADEAAGHPLQFYPTYMACIIDYGRERGRRGAWNDKPKQQR